MKANKFQELLSMKRGHLLEFTSEKASCILCPDLGGRIFAELCGTPLHRIDLACVAKPERAFNNYGGGTFWPAPEGGKFAFNYRGDEWYVQESINLHPFEIAMHAKDSAVISKRIALVNLAGATVEAIMKRELRMLHSLPSYLDGRCLKGFLTYQTLDSFQVLNAVTPNEALIAAWTLEQFETGESTVSFCPVRNPRTAINFDYYDHPEDRIAYFDHGLTYKTDGKKKGQIGIKKSSGAPFIGFYDVSRSLVCIRGNRSVGADSYFNIADNNQPRGPYSAADNYSIFNSDPDMQAFELELVAGARIKDNLVLGSELNSVTTFAVFENSGAVRDFVDHYLGG